MTPVGWKKNRSDLGAAGVSTSTTPTAMRRILVGHSAIGTGSKRRRWGALAPIVTAQFMVILDLAIVNVALPPIQLDLGFTHESLQAAGR
jgi:hypothetical protein